MKLCKNCQYFQDDTQFPNHDYGICTHRSGIATHKINYTNGDETFTFRHAQTNRQGGWLINFILRKCGRTARYYKEKDI